MIEIGLKILVQYCNVCNLIFWPFLDASPLKEPNNVRDSQEKVVQALQHYTATQYPDMPAKFAELLLRMPELHRVCQVL